MTKLAHVGFGNLVNMDEVTAVTLPNSAPIRKQVQAGNSKGTNIDLTAGRRTKAVLFLRNGTIILSALSPETIRGRVDGEQQEVSK